MDYQKEIEVLEQQIRSGYPLGDYSRRMLELIKLLFEKIEKMEGKRNEEA